MNRLLLARTTDRLGNLAPNTGEIWLIDDITNMSALKLPSPVRIAQSLGQKLSRVISRVQVELVVSRNIFSTL